ncbi:EF-hand and coiled-coil domain-containing protein 1 [Manacus vitellinus]|uniref:EF-hand and coiled-coil domain-containing protein 1 n=1 Tax=Manacus vitellinus TaxID=328815 RepID=UPI00115F03B7|nr:EF-hand and coiled-coil domain-containing protein 1 [Manacus vitellinus]
MGSKRPLPQNHSQSKCLQSVLKEMELIRSSRDGQIEEAIRFNQELERELRSSQEALVSLEDCNRNLKREQAEMRRKVEEARHAVLNSLGKVRELEVKANEVPRLQTHIQQLESELQHYRSGVERSLPEQQEGAGTRCPVGRQSRGSPAGGAGTAECDEKTWKKLMSYLESSSTAGCEADTAPAEPPRRLPQLPGQLELRGHGGEKLEPDMEEVTGPLLGELQQKVEEAELLKMELQMLETERVRLSLVEEKLMDVLQLLQQLRDLNISKRALGKMLLSTLESCHAPQPGKAHLFEVLDTLQQELAACELLHQEPVEQGQSPQSLSNALVISC